MQASDYNGMIAFLEKATLLAADLERRCASAAEQHAASAQGLEQALQRVENDLGRIVASGKDELAEHAGVAIRKALAQEIGMATRAISESANELKMAGEQLRREQSAAGVRMRMMGWKTIVAVGAAALLTVAGSSFVVWNNAQRIQRTNVQAEVMEALSQVTVTSCDGRPCMKLAEGQARWDKNADYVLVDASSGRVQQSRPSPAR